MTSPVGGSLHSLRRDNRSRLLTLLGVHGPTHRAELARRAGLSRTTVSTIVNELIEAGLVCSIDDAAPVGSRHGRPGDVLTLNLKGQVAVGMDFSRQRVNVVVADMGQSVLAESVDRISDQDWRSLMATGMKAMDVALSRAGVSRTSVIGVGLGMPGTVDSRSGRVGTSIAWMGWAGALVTEVSTLLGLPVWMDNNADLAALAEAVWGAGKDCDDLVYVHLSTGVGGGLFLGGQLIRGVVGAAGELGHISVDDSGPTCRCGNRGCLEAYAGIPAILAALRPVMGETVTFDEALDASAAGSRPARRVFSDVGQLLGRTLGGVCNLLNPERIVVGGDGSRAGEVLLEPLRESLARHALTISADSVEVVQAKLGDQAGALGGVALVLRTHTGLFANASA